jgi:hypothetical protein
MNPWQMAHQIRHELEQVAWPDGNAHLVFGAKGQRVCVFAGAPSEDQLPGAFPCCFVQIGNGTPDPDHPSLIEQTFSLMTVAEGAGDPLGEHAIVGGATPDIGQSAGRGVAELDERVRAAVADLTGADGAPIIVTATSLGSPSPLGDGQHLALSGLDLTVLCTSALHYSAPQELTITGGTAFAWEGAHCSDRWDFINYQLVELIGTSPANDPTEGTVLYTGTTASFSGVAQAGYTYTVFANYGSRPGGTVVLGTSDPEKGSYRVVSA